MIARRQGGVVRLWTRQANEVTDRFTRIAAAILALPGGDLVLDGEACCRRDGANHFAGLLSSRGAADAHLVAFDLLELDAVDLRSQPLIERQDPLAGVIRYKSRAKSGICHPFVTDGLMFSEALEGDGPTIFEHACLLGLEGIVSKRVDRPYRSGRSPFWVKTKNPSYGR